MTAAIELSHVRYRAGRGFEIPDLSFGVPAGSIYGFLGPNGAGKTTTIRLVMGLLRPTAGTVTLLGEPMPRRAPAALARTGYVPEQPHLDPTLTVAESLRFHGAFYPGWDAAWAESLRRAFALAPDRTVAQLSKGMKGKLMILLALAQRPDVLVLDEPTDGLDPVVRRDILAALLDYVAQRRATVLISSHLVHELERFCDHVGVMDAGRLVADVPMDRFKNGIKRLHLSAAPTATADLPFAVLSREANGHGETWVVRDWAPEMTAALARAGGTIREIVDLDLEDGFVELLHAFRSRRGEVG